MAVHPRSRPATDQRECHRRPPRRPAAHEHNRGPLLPSGSDGVDGGSLHRAGRWISVAPSGAARRDPCKGNSAPLERIAGYRAPLAPHLARPILKKTFKTSPILPRRWPERAPDPAGGERGIRTLGTVSRTHAFQACSLSHSDTSPHDSPGAPVSGRNGVIVVEAGRSGQRDTPEAPGRCPRG